MYFPDVEKADWINTVIQQLWPFVGKYVKTIIFDQVRCHVVVAINYKACEWYLFILTILDQN